MPAVLALPGAHLQLRGHHATSCLSRASVPDHGLHLEEDHGACTAGPHGEQHKDGRLCTCRSSVKKLP